MDKRKVVAGVFAAATLISAGLASATQLNMLWGGNFQAGSVAVSADCQPSSEAITAKFANPTWNGTGTLPWSVATVTFSGINAACNGDNYEVGYKLTADTSWTKIAGTTISGTSVTVNLPGGVDVQDIKSLALTVNK